MNPVLREIKRRSLFERVLRPAKLANIEFQQIEVPESSDLVSSCVIAETSALIARAEEAQSELITVERRRPSMLLALHVPNGFAVLASARDAEWIIEHLPVETPRGTAAARLMGLDIFAVPDVEISRLYVLRHDPGLFDRRQLEGRKHTFKVWMRPESVRIIEVKS